MILLRVCTETFLRAKGVFKIFQEDIFGTTTETLRDELQNKVVEAHQVTIRGVCDKPLRTCIMKNRDPYRMWKPMSERYAVLNVAPRVNLLSRLNRLKFSGEVITYFIDAIGWTYNLLETMQRVVEENVRVAILLAFLKDKDRSLYTNILIALQIANENLT